MFILPPPPPAFYSGIIQVQDRSRYLTITTRMDVTVSRDEIIQRAAREGAARGWGGDPVIVSETPTDNGTSFLLEFRGENSAVPPAPVRPAAPSRPSWVLVVPVEEKRGHAVWDRTPWTAAWLVPFRKDGLRMVATVGDSEDREGFTGRDMQSNAAAMGRMARKYGAPAVAVLRAGDDGVIRVSLLRNGAVVTDTVADSGGSPETRRTATAELVSRMMGTTSTAVASENTGDISPMLSVTSREGQSGTLAVSILCDTSDEDEHAEARKIIKSLAGFTQTSSSLTDDGLVFKGNWNGTVHDMEEQLIAAGATVNGRSR